SLILQFCGTLLARLLVLLAVGPLAVHAAVLDEEAGRAALELDDVTGTGSRPTIGASLVIIFHHRQAAHSELRMPEIFECAKKVSARAREKSTGAASVGRAAGSDTVTPAAAADVWFA
ncbi:hypothetical protein THAOC_06319, partial [Thalassiosira oceanica]